MKEIKQKIITLKQLLPAIKQFGGLDKSALKTITEELEEILSLIAKEEANKLKKLIL